MSKVRPRLRAEEMLPKYDFSGGVRGEYANRFAKGTIMVVLDPDVAGPGKPPPLSPVSRRSL